MPPLGSQHQAPSIPHRILDFETLQDDPGAAMEFARSKSEARKEGLTGIGFKDVAALDPILGEVLEVVEVGQTQCLRLELIIMANPAP